MLHLLFCQKLKIYDEYTVLPVKSDSNVMFCLQSNNPGLIIDSSDGNWLDFHDRSSV